MHKKKFSEQNINSFLHSLEKETWYDVYMASVETKYDTFNRFYELFHFTFSENPNQMLCKEEKLG